MTLTNRSLLLRARDGSEEAWSQLFDLYRPFVERWLRRFTRDPHDADDLCQDVLLTVYKQLPHFDHNGQPGAFRSWLRVVTTNRALTFCRDQRRSADSDLSRMADELQDPDGEMSQLWQKEHDEHVVRSLLHSLTGEFEPATLSAFRRLTLEGVSAPELAEEMGVTIGTIYVFKSRVLRRLREQAQELLC